MNSDDVEVMDVEEAFNGYFRVDRYHLKHKQFSGGTGAPVSREIFERGHAACCLLYDPVLDRLVMIEQFRAGAYAALKSPWFDEEGFSPWLIEIVAGIIEPGESPEEVIKRESMEEAGCAVLHLEPIRHYLVTPGGSTESMFAFIGRVDSSGAGGVHGLKEEGEDIRVFCADVGEVFDMLDTGKIVNSMTIIPLQWFQRHHEDIRRRWLEND